MKYRDLFRVREFRYLYMSLTLSYVGDQLSAVAVSVLVFDRTGSSILTAVAYASAWLPGIVGGPILGPLADRLPRREVLIVCDMVRAALLVVLAIPGLPIGPAVVLLYITHLFRSPFTAARSALMPEVLDGQAYITGNGLTNITHQVTQVVGFGVGGVLVTVLGSSGTLLLDAATFVASAVLIRAGVLARPAVAPQKHQVTVLRDSVAGLRYVLGDRWLRSCLLLVWFGLALPFGPEAIAYPYARELGGGARAAGAMLAAPGLGYIVGAVLLTRVLAGTTRDRLLVPFALLSAAALIPALLSPPLPVVVGLFVIVGFGSAFSAPLNAVYAQRVKAEYRGRAMAVAISGILALQGLAFLLAGALVDTGLRPASVVGILGTVGVVAVGAAAMTWRTADHAGGQALDDVPPAARSGPSE